MPEPDPNLPATTPPEAIDPPAGPDPDPSPEALASADQPPATKHPTPQVSEDDTDLSPAPDPVPAETHAPTPEAHPMIEVHPPHEKIHTVKDFLIHIAAIAVGLLLAIGLEQSVEYIHHLRQAHDLEESLMQESESNRDVVMADITSIDSAIEALETEAADLDKSSVSATKPAFVYTPNSKNFYLLPVSNTAWLTVRDGGSLSLLSSRIVDDYWHTDYYAAESIAQLQDLFKDLYETSALIHMHKDESVRSLEEKAQLLQSFARLTGDFRHLRSTLLSFDEANDIAISGEAFTEKKMKELSQQESALPAN